jgi:hypothetical protein
MAKKRYFSAKDDFKTGFTCKLTLFFGLLLFLIYFFSELIGLIVGENSSGVFKQIYDFSQSTSPNSILAISIILFAIGIILYFFHCQFAKLASIADEIEKSENLDDLD